MSNINPKLQQKLQAYIKNECDGKQAVAARKLGWSEAYISQYLKGKFSGNIENFENSISEIFSNIEAASALKSAKVINEYKPTSISEAVYNQIKLCHLKGGLAIECGDAGIGKTMACKKYIEDNPNTTIYVSVNPCFAKLGAFLKLLCKVQKISTPLRKDEMWLRLSESFNGERKVLIIDEAQHLPIETIEAIRSFYDTNPQLGICFVGNPETITMQGRREQAFAQIKNRTKRTVVRHTKSITKKDILLLFPSVADDSKSVDLLLGIARSEQGLRGAMNVFSNGVDNGNITYAGLYGSYKDTVLTVA